MEAAMSLIAEGLIPEAAVPIGSDGYRAPTSAFIDGIEYDGKKPNEYLNKLEIGLKKESV